MQNKQYLGDMIAGLLRRIDAQQRKLSPGLNRDYCQIIYRRLRGTQMSLGQIPNKPFEEVPFADAILATIRNLQAEIRDMDGLEDCAL